jgi:predicted DNA-binding transcriptional regulator YafY
MQRLDRLERVTDLLLVLLDTSQPLSLREIADRVPGYPDGHGARRQAFERDKRLLRDEGVPVLTEPIAGEDQRGYRVDPDAYYLPDLGLEAEEQAALNLAVAGVHLGEPIGHDALLKLGAGAESPLRTAGAPLVDLRSLEALPALPLLFDALRLGAAVEFSYRREHRHVDPAGLRFRSGHWYLVAHDRVRGDARTFRVDRIEGLPSLGPASSAALPEGFDADLHFSRDPWQFGSGEEIEVEVLIDPAEAGRVTAELGPESVVEHRDDGGVVVRLTVTDQEALILWVLDLLDHAEVLGPETLRAAVVARLTAMAGGGGETAPGGSPGRPRSRSPKASR